MNAEVAAVSRCDRPLALVANLIWPAHLWRKLPAPMALATVGLLLATLPGGQAPAGNGGPAAGELFGLLAAFGAVALWTGYGLANARFLSRHPDVPHAGWPGLAGLATGVITLLSLPVTLATHQLGGSGPHSIRAEPQTQRARAPRRRAGPSCSAHQQLYRRGDPRQGASG